MLAMDISTCGDLPVLDIRRRTRVEFISYDSTPIMSIALDSSQQTGIIVIGPFAVINAWI